MRYGGNIAAAVYVALLAVFVFWIFDKQVLYGSDAKNLAFLGFAVVLHLALGFLANRPALPLPFLAVVMALPLGYPSANKGEPLPIWLGLLLWAPFAMLAVAIGIRARQIYDGRQSA
jgi:hypothetical protein